MHEQPPTPPKRRIAHLDMDAFYASVELLRYPDLRGLPVVIGGSRRGLPAGAGPAGHALLRDYVGRGVVTTATYPAREFGVHSARSISTSTPPRADTSRAAGRWRSRSRPPSSSAPA
jgi:DNA polymerase-4